MSPIDRREFILLGSTILVLGPPAMGAGSIGAEPMERISVGFAESTPEDSRLTPASALLQGDPAFLRRDAMVTMNGSMTRGRFESLVLTALYPMMVDGQSTIVPFHGWTYRREPFHQGAPLRFFMPVHPEGLSFAVQTPPGESLFRFGVHPARGNFPLLRGHYVLLFHRDDERAPDWESLTLPASDHDYLSLDFDYGESHG